MCEFQKNVILTSSYTNVSTKKEQTMRQMLENLSWCQIHLYTQHTNIADKNYEKNEEKFRDLGFLTVDVFFFYLLHV